MVSLSAIPTNKAIFNVQFLFYMTIKVEPYRSSGPAQCYNCQRFGHSSQFCGSSKRFLKCASSHQTRECQKTIDVTLKCANCLGEHTANYKQSPDFVKLKQQKPPSASYSKPQLFSALQHIPNSNTVSTKSNQTLTYANITAPKEETKINSSLIQDIL